MSLQQWYNDIPPVTRVLFTSSFALTLLPAFNFLSASNLVLSYNNVIYGFEVKRNLQYNIFIIMKNFSFYKK